MICTWKVGCAPRPDRNEVWCFGAAGSLLPSECVITGTALAGFLAKSRSSISWSIMSSNSLTSVSAKRVPSTFSSLATKKGFIFGLFGSFAPPTPSIGGGGGPAPGGGGGPAPGSGGAAVSAASSADFDSSATTSTSSLSPSSPSGGEGASSPGGCKGAAGAASSIDSSPSDASSGGAGASSSGATRRGLLSESVADSVSVASSSSSPCSGCGGAAALTSRQHGRATSRYLELASASMGKASTSSMSSSRKFESWKAKASSG
mmetsp:Transcript_2019/g.7293  ORF Transcript_2019/g.7293 Transcript_2019/m.7293 type:complete len:262 (-) Transcript_2019:1151-1936(-)